MNDLIKQCRYYKGEQECPQNITDIQMEIIWYYEQLWVEREELRNETESYIIEYNYAGLKDFNTDDGTPITLKALLYNRHNHWSGSFEKGQDVINFKNWYLNTYIKLS